MANSYISQVQVGSTTYDIKDSGARSLIADLEAYSDYLGVTTTELTDGSTTNPVTINGESVTAKKGNIVNYGSKEFIWNGATSGACWQEFGDLSALGDLAYEDTAEGSYTPAGTVSGTAVSYNPTTESITPFGTAGTLPSLSVSGEVLSLDAGSLPTAGTAVSAVTALGSPTITDPTFSGTAATITVSAPSGT